jgi:hypothetical protein
LEQHPPRLDQWRKNPQEPRTRTSLPHATMRSCYTYHTNLNPRMTRIYHSPYPPLNIPTNKSVSQFLLECNPDDVEPSKTIVEDFDSHSTALTYGGLRRDASQCAYALRHQLGLRAGDTVCIVAKNSVNWVLLAHAVMWAGGCFRYVNPPLIK